MRISRIYNNNVVLTVDHYGKGVRDDWSRHCFW